MTTGVQSLLRGLAILDALADAPDGVASLAQIVKSTGLSPSTAHRLLTTLVECSYVGRDRESKGYVIGHRVIHFSSTVMRRTAELRSIVRPHLNAITAETGETSNLVVLDQKSVVYVDQVEGSRALRMVPGIGSIFPAYTSASAKAILAYQIDDALLSAIFTKTPLIKRASHTLTEKEAFLIALDDVMQRGYAIEEEELEEGASCIAAPIRGQDGVAIAAISVPGPTTRLLAPSPDRLGNLVKTHALQVSVALGFKQWSKSASG